MEKTKIIETIYHKLMNLKMSYRCVCQFIAPHAREFKRIRFHFIDNFVDACCEVFCSLTRNGVLNFKSLIKDNDKLEKEFENIINSEEYKNILNIRNRKIAHLIDNKKIKDLEYVILNQKKLLNDFIYLLELCKKELNIKNEDIKHYTQEDFEDYNNELGELCSLLFNNWSEKLHKETDDFIKSCLIPEDYEKYKRIKGEI